MNGLAQQLRKAGLVSDEQLAAVTADQRRAAHEQEEASAAFTVALQAISWDMTRQEMLKAIKRALLADPGRIVDVRHHALEHLRGHPDYAHFLWRISTLQEAFKAYPARQHAAIVERAMRPRDPRFTPI